MRNARAVYIIVSVLAGYYAHAHQLAVIAVTDADAIIYQVINDLQVRSRESDGNQNQFKQKSALYLLCL